MENMQIAKSLNEAITMGLNEGLEKSRDGKVIVETIHSYVKDFLAQKFMLLTASANEDISQSGNFLWNKINEASENETVVIPKVTCI